MFAVNRLGEFAHSVVFELFQFFESQIFCLEVKKFPTNIKKTQLNQITCSFSKNFKFHLLYKVNFSV